MFIFKKKGGYFVINGGEKVVIAHERMANNQVNKTKINEIFRFLNKTKKIIGVCIST